MKITGYRWIGILVHDYEATCNFFRHDLRLELDWTDDKKEITKFRFPSGQAGIPSPIYKKAATRQNLWKITSRKSEHMTYLGNRAGNEPLNFG